MEKHPNTMSLVNQMMQYYQNDALIRTLIQLIPWGAGSAVDAAITTTWNGIQQDRTKVFFDEVSERGVGLTDERIQSLAPNEDFLHIYYATLRAAVNTRRREKIRLFARLLSGFIKKKATESSDAYEEQLQILDDLSYQEFQILLLLYRFETREIAQEEHGAVEGLPKFWEDFLVAMVKELGIPRDRIAGILARLSRTGLYYVLIETFAGFSTGNKGRLSPNFGDFLSSLGFGNEP